MLLSLADIAGIRQHTFSVCLGVIKPSLAAPQLVTLWSIVALKWSGTDSVV